MGVLVLFACINPRREILLWFVLRVQIRWLVLFLLVMDLMPALAALTGKEYEKGIAHAAHLGGMLFGFLYFKWNLKLAPIFSKISPIKLGSGGGKKKSGPKKRSSLSVVGRSKAEIDRQVDELLEKISAKGFQSLTDKEKEFMAKASDKFGKR